MACAELVHEEAKAAKFYGKLKLDATVEEDTVEDGTCFAPNTHFCKTWKLRNNSRFPWPKGTHLKHVGGNRLRGPFSVDVPISENGLQPGEVVEVVVDLISPSSINRYTSHWNLVDPNGNLFGPRIWIMIEVVRFEFAESATLATQTTKENMSVSLDISMTAEKNADPISEKGSNEKTTAVDDATLTVSAMPDNSANLSNHRPSFSCELNTDSSTVNQPIHREPSSKQELDSKLVHNVTLCEGEKVCPGEKIKKKWLVCNNGAVSWPQFSRLVCVGGNIFAENDFVSIPNIPENGLSRDQEVEISVDLLAPGQEGFFVSQWRLMAPGGRKFGTTLTAEMKVVSDKIKFVPQNRLRDNADAGQDSILPGDVPIMFQKGVEQENEMVEIGNLAAFEKQAEKEKNVDGITVDGINVSDCFNNEGLNPRQISTDNDLQPVELSSSNPIQNSTEEDLHLVELSNSKGNEMDEYCFIESPKENIMETGGEGGCLFDEAIYVDSKTTAVGDSRNVHDKKVFEDGLSEMNNTAVSNSCGEGTDCGLSEDSVNILESAKLPAKIDNDDNDGTANSLHGMVTSFLTKRSIFDEALFEESKNKIIAGIAKNVSESNGCLTRILDEKELQKSLSLLLGMGFEDEELNRKLLLKNKGSLKYSVKDLIKLEKKT